MDVISEIAARYGVDVSIHGSVVSIDSSGSLESCVFKFLKEMKKELREDVNREK